MTMIELLVGIAIVAIIAAIGVPSLRNWLMAQRVAAIGTEVLTDFQLARSEAISRNIQTVVSFRSGAGFTCYTINTVVSVAQATCNCTLGAGSACTGAANGNVEIKTVTIPSSTGVSVTSSPATLQYLPNAQFGNSNANLTVLISDGGSKRLNVVGSAYVRRPTICTPAGYTMNGFKPC